MKMNYDVVSMMTNIPVNRLFQLKKINYQNPKDN